MNLKTNYISQLDGLRAIAVILVIIHHWFSPHNKASIYTSLFNGVDIFFVLSGFLITRILINNKVESEEKISTKGNLIKNFFIRRSLRIFPIYYLTITILFVFSDSTGTDIKNSFPFFFTYTANLYFFNRDEWDGMLSHLWSLSVEEQFYLVWPWLILFIKRNYILATILTFILIGLLTHIYFEFLSQAVIPSIFTLSCFDGLGLGALMAWIVIYKRSMLEKFYPILLIVALICVGLQIERVFGGGLYILPSRTLTSLCTIWLISWIILFGDTKKSFINSILNQKYLVFTGKISYGIYLYHLIIPYYTNHYLTSINSHFPIYIFKYNFYLVIAENFIIVLLISFISWNFIEFPILKLKKYFEYQDNPHPVLSPVPVFNKPPIEKEN
jgi:peptidoglycan/LPS O-acetylase OafA/YrhL